MHHFDKLKKTPISTHKNPFLSLQTELGRAIEAFYNIFDNTSLSKQNFENLIITPSIDIVEDNENFKVEAEMPGMDEKDIKVSINNGMLTIKGEKETSRKDEGKDYLLREINYGSYERSIPLPDSVDIDTAKASFKKGMLWINIPKKKESIKRNKELTIEKTLE